MNLSSPWIWLPILALGVAGVIALPRWAARKRRTAVKMALSSSGFDAFEGRKPFSRADRKRLPLLRRGYGGRFTDISHDERGRLLFDYQYRFGLPHLGHVYHVQTVIAFPAKMAAIPDFQLAPATQLDKVLKKAASSTVILAGRPDFSNRYWLSGSEHTHIAALFSSKLIDQFTALDPESRWSVEKGGDWMLIYMADVVFAPSSLPNFVVQTDAVARLFLPDTSVTSEPRSAGRSFR